MWCCCRTADMVELPGVMGMTPFGGVSRWGVWRESRGARARYFQPPEKIPPGAVWRRKAFAYCRIPFGGKRRQAR